MLDRYSDTFPNDRVSCDILDCSHLTSLRAGVLMQFPNIVLLHVQRCPMMFTTIESLAGGCTRLELLTIH
jgi:hypothetical protein